jgi:predicted dinucleotide-binding enzyme
MTQALVARGHQVRVGTRDPEQTGAREEWSGQVDLLVPYARVAQDSDLVILATNGQASLSALEAVGEDQLAGRVVLDVSNPLDFSAGFPPTLFVKDTDSLAEQLQRRFPEMRLVKTCNTMSALVMVDPGGLPTETTIFVAGNDPGAREQTAVLLRELGWQDILDLGDLTAARGLEMWLPLWIRLLQTLGTPRFNIKVVR